MNFEIGNIVGEKKERGNGKDRSRRGERRNRVTNGRLSSSWPRLSANPLTPPRPKRAHRMN